MIVAMLRVVEAAERGQDEVMPWGSGLALAQVCSA